MGRRSRFSPELRERAVRLVMEQRPAHPSEWAALQAVAPKLGTTAETLRQMGAAGRARHWPATRARDERARAVEGVGA
jgi:transposase